MMKFGDSNETGGWNLINKLDKQATKEKHKSYSLRSIKKRVQDFREQIYRTTRSVKPIGNFKR